MQPLLAALFPYIFTCMCVCVCKALGVRVSAAVVQRCASESAQNKTKKGTKAADEGLSLDTDRRVCCCSSLSLSLSKYAHQKKKKTKPECMNDKAQWLAAVDSRRVTPAVRIRVLSTTDTAALLNATHKAIPWTGSRCIS